MVVPRAELRESATVAVGHDKQPLSTVGRADVGGGDDARLHSIPKPVEVGRNSVQPTRHEGRHVLDDHDSRAKLSDDASELGPEAGAGAVDACAFARERDVLTGKSATNHLHGSQVVSADEAHVRMTSGRGPVPGEDAAAPRVKLDLPGHGTDARPLKAKLEAADAGEERAHGTGRLGTVRLSRDRL